MPARTPEDVDRCLAEAFTAKDLEALVALYEPNATLVPQPGQPVTGHAAIRAALQGLLALNPHLEIALTSVTRTGDLALLASAWTLTGTGADGQPMCLADRGAEVVRRQSDGTWRYILDNPFMSAGSNDGLS